MEQNKWKDILMKYKVYIAVIAVLLVLVIVLVKGCGNNEEQEVQEPETTTEQPEEAEEETEPENNLEENSHATIDRLIERYCEYIANGDVDNLEAIVDVLTDEEKEKIINRAAFIQSYDNVKCYTKNGPVEDSYIVFVCYDMKLINIETSAPDIICLYVEPKDENNDRRIHYGSIDESMQEYVAELEEDPEVQALYDDVSTRYQQAQESDETLAAFIRKISGQVEEEPEETAEEAENSEETAEETENAEETAEAEEPQEENAEEAEGEASVQNRETRVTESVNVRSEASTESERLALAYQGDPITQIESYDDGWSKVEYKGLTGYVKTEFLE